MTDVKKYSYLLETQTEIFSGKMYLYFVLFKYYKDMSFYVYANFTCTKYIQNPQK